MSQLSACAGELLLGTIAHRRLRVLSGKHLFIFKREAYFLSVLQVPLFYLPSKHGITALAQHGKYVYVGSSHSCVYKYKIYFSQV